MECVQYIDDESTATTVKPQTNEFKSTYIATLKPMQLPHQREVFRPIIKEAEPINRDRSFTIRKPLPKLDLPLEKIPFACVEDYLQYKELYGS